MTATLAPQPPPSVSPRVALAALAVTEVRLLWGMSTFWLGWVLAVALCTVWGWTTQPRWDVFAANSGMASLVLAGFLLLIGHLVASRDHRHVAVEASTTLPASPERRTAAVSAIIPAAGVAGAFAVCVELLALLPARPGGSFDPWLIAVPVVVPMIGAAVGVTAGRWLPSTPVGPITLFTGAALLAILPVLGSSSGDLPWLTFPVVLDEAIAPGFPRPTGWHLGYLVGVLGVVVGVALLRHRRLLASLVLGLSLVTAVVGVQRQQAERLPVDPVSALPYLVESAQQCEQRAGVTYCPLRGYGHWIPLWQRAVDPVVAAIPAAAATDLPPIRQGSGPASSVIVDQHWGRHGRWARASRVALSAEFIRVLLGMPDQLAGDPGPLGTPERNRAVLPRGTMSLSTGPMCSGAGQLRTVVALWLLAQSEPDGAALLGDSEKPKFGRVAFGPEEIATARRLLELPRERVTAQLAKVWPSAATAAPVGEALAPLGITVSASEGGETPCP